MLALLAWLCTSIFWTLSASETLPPAMAMETEPQRAAQLVATRHLFGEAVSGDAATASVDIRLSGVIAAQQAGSAALAFLSLDGKTATAVREGDEVAPGITLSRVLPRQVELSRGGRTQILTLPQRSKP